jgi:hypothetical protein
LRKSVASNSTQEFGVERGVPLKPTVEVSAEPVVPVDLVEQLGDEARDAADALDLPLTA